MFTSVSSRQLIVLLGVLALCESAVAGFVTSPDEFGDATVVAFTGSYIDIGAGSQLVRDVEGDNVTLSNDGTKGKFGDLSTRYNLGSNGKWTSGKGGVVTIGERIGTDTAATVRFEFEAAVNAVGSYMNYAPGNGPFTLSVFDLENNLLESYDLTQNADWAISTSGEDQSAFRGIIRDSSDIAAFEMSGAYGAMEDLYFSRSDGIQAVPEPSSLALVGVGAGVAAVVRLGGRRSKRGAENTADGEVA